MSAKKILVSFIVLNWNGLEDTLVCLESIRKQTIDNFEIIVVDNGSSEEQKAHLRNTNDITLIDLAKNEGFTGGQIKAREQANGEFLALINNDSVIDKRWAQVAVDTLKSNPDAAAIGGKAYKWDESNPKFDTNNEFYSYQVVNMTTGHTKTVTYGETVYCVNSISGAAVLIRKDITDNLGYFDSRFFAYYEETDLFARFKRKGYKILYEPRLHVWHKIAQSTRQKPNFYLYQMHRNRFMFAVKNYDKPYLRKFIRHYFGEVSRAVAHTLRHGVKNSSEQVCLIKSALWNTAHLIPTYKARKRIVTPGSFYNKLLLKDKAESITVIIPCYNYETFVAEAIESVLKQTVLPDEIIVINDGSADNSLHVIKRFADKVQIIDQSNQGVVKTKNMALKKSTSDWVIFLDADDKLHKDYIANLGLAAREYNADVVYSGMTFFGAEDGIFPSRPFTVLSIRKGNYINNSAMMRKDALLSVGGYKDIMSSGFEDWELYLSLAEKKAKFRYIDEPLLFYRRHIVESRDKVAKKNLSSVHETIRQLHPQMFSLKQRFLSLLYTVLTFHQRRTPLQLIRDLKYKMTSALDAKSENSASINKAMGFVRLLGAGQYKKAGEKLKLNARRLWKKIAR